MYCPNCGIAVADDEKLCPACFADLGEGVAPPVPSHLVGSVLVTLFCCAPLGIVAIVYSSQVGAKLASGDLFGASLSSRRAKNLIILAVGINVLLWLFVLISAVTDSASR